MYMGEKVSGQESKSNLHIVVLKSKFVLDFSLCLIVVRVKTCLFESQYFYRAVSNITYFYI